MNDTTETQDELVEQIQLLVSAGSIWYSPEGYIPMSGVEQLNIGLPATTAERIIALVRAAAWQDFAAAMLSDTAVAAFWDVQPYKATGSVAFMTGAKNVLAAIAPTEGDTDE